MESRKTPKITVAINEKTAADQSQSFILPLEILVDDLIPILHDENYLAACKYTFFTVFPKKRFGNFLKQTVDREYHKAGAYLLDHPHWLTHKGTITDGFLDADNQPRVFKNISALQYAAWAYDMPTLYWLLLHWAVKHLPDDTKMQTLQWIETQSGKSYSLELLKAKLDECLQFVPIEDIAMISDHLQELEVFGTENGAHYNFQLFIETMKLLRQKQSAFFSFTIRNMGSHNPARIRMANLLAQDTSNYVLHEFRDCERQTTLQVVHEYCCQGKHHETRLEYKTFQLDELPHTEKLIVDYLPPEKWTAWRSSIADGSFEHFAALRSSGLNQGRTVRRPIDQPEWLDCGPSDLGCNLGDMIPGTIKLFQIRTIQYNNLVAQLQTSRSVNKNTSDASPKPKTGVLNED